MVNRSKVGWCAKTSARTAVIVFVSIFIVSPVSAFIGFVFGGKFRFDWPIFLKFDFAFSLAWFCVAFVWNLISAIRRQPALDILGSDSLSPDVRSLPATGFVAMEYFWGILNRTFLVFVAPEGLYGWKAFGPVTNGDKAYFEPLLEMLGDAELMRDRARMGKLAELRGGFYLERSRILSVAADEKGQWGMGGIAHTGHIRIVLKSGRPRQFILLGSQTPGEVRDRVVRTLNPGVTSVL